MQGASAPQQAVLTQPQDDLHVEARAHVMKALTGLSVDPSIMSREGWEEYSRYVCQFVELLYQKALSHRDERNKNVSRGDVIDGYRDIFPRPWRTRALKIMSGLAMTVFGIAASELARRLWFTAEPTSQFLWASLSAVALVSVTAWIALVVKE